MRPIQRFNERFSPPQRVAIVALGALELSAKAAALRDIARRPAEQLRGPKAFWRAAQLVNGLGPLSYFLVARR